MRSVRTSRTLRWLLPLAVALIGSAQSVAAQFAAAPTSGAPSGGAQSAAAVALFAADFQDDTTTGWTAVGSADVRLSSFQDKGSLRLSAGAAALASFSSAGYRQVVVTLAFAGQHLGSTGACVADLSTDRGHSWIEAARLHPGEDDGLTLHRNGALLAPLADASHVILRVRNVAIGSRAACWVDDVRVEATPMLPGEESAAAASVRRALRVSDLGPAKVKATGAAAGPATVTATAAAESDGPWPMIAFARPADARAPRQSFEGRLQLLAERPGGGFQVLLDRYGDAAADQGAAAHLPTFDFEFIQSGDALVPVRRGAISSDHPQWEFILEPGRVWQEDGDGDFSRASLPFALEERNANCMHNGVLTFLFNSDGAISDVAYEIGQETCSYFQFDAWGRFAARYTPGAVTSHQAVLDGYAQEVAHRLPTRPIAALATDHPGADSNRFGSPAEVPADSMTLYGLIIDGVHYTAGCQTRFGAYPYCDQLDLPSYSLAKSLVGGLASMRMARLYPGVLAAPISELVPECRGAAGWDQVTIENALDMASGHFNSRDFEVDEDAPELQAFLLAEDHATRIEFACRHYPFKAAPGSTWVYRTTDTYLLGTALAAYYLRTQRPGADWFQDMWVAQFWAPLHLHPALAVTRRTRDAARQPFTGYGLTLQADDVAKLVGFIHAAHGMLDGEQSLDRRLLDEALQRDPAHRGLTTPVRDLRYQHGFWAWNAQQAMGCREPTWIPFMSGFGGITVALMPNGIDYYYFSDGNVLSWARAAAEADRMRPFCRRQGDGTRP
jgi:hypothetical protein